MSQCLQPEQTIASKKAVQPNGGCVVIGAGPVGIRVAQELHQRGHPVTVLGAEAATPYNRVRLTPLLGGQVQLAEISLLTDEPDNAPFPIHLGQHVIRIDRSGKKVITASGHLWSYDTLVLATGSHAFVPGIPGRDLPGVLTFRTAADTSALIARSISARRIAVIGGGLLGLEAARGMRQRQGDVTVIEHEARLMPRQLDKAGGALLADRMEELGVNVLTGVAVKEIIGEHRVTGLRLDDGTEREFDTVIICTGVRPNVNLARSTQLAFGRGITVDDAMRTTDPDIFAVGECAEHAGILHGQVGPGFAQAETAANAITGTPIEAQTIIPATKLKVIGADVFSVGEVERLEAAGNIRSHTWSREGAYRRIFVDRGVLVGAIGVGTWDQASRVQDAVQQGQSIYPWMLFRFGRVGMLWPDRDLTASEMPDAATLCNCTSITCGQVRGAIGNGACSVEGIGAQTGAGTVCGTCRPLLAEMLDGDAKPQPVPLWKPVLAMSSIAATLAAAPLLSGNVPLPSSFSADSLRVWLWTDNIVKQWSGFILLGLTLLAMTVGVRKRLRWTDRLGSFDAWRLVHLGVGLAALGGFFAHTGFSLGSGWNFALGLFFAATVLIGAIAGLATGGDHELRARQIGSTRSPPRKLPTWLHIMAVWPLPVLILMHVLASYAF